MIVVSYSITMLSFVKNCQNVLSYGKLILCYISLKTDRTFFITIFVSSNCRLYLLDINSNFSSLLLPLIWLFEVYTHYQDLPFSASLFSGSSPHVPVSAIAPNSVFWFVQQKRLSFLSCLMQTRTFPPLAAMKLGNSPNAVL